MEPSGIVGICLTESPTIVTLPLAKPAKRVMACSLGLIDPWITGVGTPCTQVLAVILGIGSFQQNSDLVISLTTGEHGTEREIGNFPALRSSAIATIKDKISNLLTHVYSQLSLRNFD